MDVAFMVLRRGTSRARAGAGLGAAVAADQREVLRQALADAVYHRYLQLDWPGCGADGRLCAGWSFVADI